MLQVLMRNFLRAVTCRQRKCATAATSSERLEERILPAHVSLITLQANVEWDYSITYLNLDTFARETFSGAGENSFTDYFLEDGNAPGNIITRGAFRDRTGDTGYEGALAFEARSVALLPPHYSASRVKAETASGSAVVVGTAVFQLTPDPGELIGDAVAVQTRLRAGMFNGNGTDVATISASGFVNVGSSSSGNSKVSSSTDTARVGDTVTIQFTAPVHRVSNLLAFPDDEGFNYTDIASEAGVSCVFTLVPLTVNTYVSTVRFEGAEGTPSSKIAFDWGYQGGEIFTGSDTFAASVYYSTDQLFDSGDIPIGNSQTIIADSASDSGTGVFEFGANTPLRPDKQRPYVLVVLDNGEDRPLPADNVKALLLPYVEIKSITADAQVGKKNKWESTLMHETTFVLDSTSDPDANYQVEYRRLDSPMQGEKIEWTTFADSQSTTVKGPHRLAGLFEFRAVVEIDGVKFTSDIYGSVTKGKKTKPQIEVLFPLGSDIRANKTVQDVAKQIFQDVDSQIVAGGYQFSWEGHGYVALDTSTGAFVLQSPYSPSSKFPMDPGLLQSEIHVNIQQPKPDLYDAQSHSAVYVVAYLHTHPRVDLHPNITNPYRPVGPSTPNTSKYPDTTASSELPKAIKKQLPCVVYDWVGQPISQYLPNGGYKKFLQGANVIYTGYNYAADPGTLTLFGPWKRRVDLKK